MPASGNRHSQTSCSAATFAPGAGRQTSQSHGLMKRAASAHHVLPGRCLPHRATIGLSATTLDGSLSGSRFPTGRV
jgi:hypothetical protein